MADIDDMLLELKDTTDLMVDLAYSSLLYNNVEIAEEVVMLSDKMSDLADSIQNELVGVVKANPDEASRSLMTARLMDSMLDIADATGSIADTVIRGLADHPVLAMSIRGADTTMCLAKVLPDSILAGKTFGELSLSTNSSMFVIAIRRDGGYIFGPDHAQRIEVDDILIAKGPEESVSFFKDLADGTAKSLERCRLLRRSCNPGCVRRSLCLGYARSRHPPAILFRFSMAYRRPFSGLVHPEQPLCSQREDDVSPRDRSEDADAGVRNEVGDGQGNASVHEHRGGVDGERGHRGERPEHSGEQEQPDVRRDAGPSESQKCQNQGTDQIHGERGPRELGRVHDVSDTETEDGTDCAADGDKQNRLDQRRFHFLISLVGMASNPPSGTFGRSMHTDGIQTSAEIGNAGRRR